MLQLGLVLLLVGGGAADFTATLGKNSNLLTKTTLFYGLYLGVCGYVSYS